MAEPLNGLRFDIYERVQLPEEAASIAELEEIELLPNMQTVTQEDQIVLKGHLLLSGVYRPQESDVSGERLEYQIPVEISLPPARVRRVEDLRVSIDHFDVDLLSARALNVTGVLALQGLQDEPPQPPVWRDDSFTVVHQAQPAGAWSGQEEGRQEEPPWFGDGASAAPEERYSQLSDDSRADAVGSGESFFSPLRAETKAFNQDESEDGQAALQADRTGDGYGDLRADRTGDGYDDLRADRTGDGYGDLRADRSEDRYDALQTDQTDLVRSEQAQEDRLSYAGDREDAGSQAYQAESAGPDERADTFDTASTPVSSTASFAATSSSFSSDSAYDATAGSFSPAASDALEEQARQPEENRDEELAETGGAKPDLKVAVGRKTPDAASTAAAGVGLLSALAEKSEAQQAGVRSASAAPAEAEEAYVSQPAGTGDEVEWTKLFLSKNAGEEQFRKVRMYIVQRDDTLESVAARYNVQIKDLQLHNKLSDAYLSEGQVLYIP